jgi:hypothetical protein
MEALYLGLPADVPLAEEAKNYFLTKYPEVSPDDVAVDIAGDIMTVRVRYPPVPEYIIVQFHLPGEEHGEDEAPVDPAAAE